MLETWWRINYTNQRKHISSNWFENISKWPSERAYYAHTFHPAHMRDQTIHSERMRETERVEERKNCNKL